LCLLSFHNSMIQRVAGTDGTVNGRFGAYKATWSGQNVVLVLSRSVQPKAVCVLRSDGQGITGGHMLGKIQGVCCSECITKRRQTIRRTPSTWALLLLWVTSVQQQTHQSSADCSDSHDLYSKLLDSSSVSGVLYEVKKKKKLLSLSLSLCLCSLLT
jgi:hypothetical protein